MDKQVEHFWRIVGSDGRKPGFGNGDRGDVSPSEKAIATGRDGFDAIDYAAAVARAAELSGFYGALLPTSRQSNETWLVSAALARETRKLHFLIAFQTGFIQPAYAAQMAATLQRITHGRVDWNIITGGDLAEQRAQGDYFAHDERYARTEDWLVALRKYWSDENAQHDGPFYRYEGGGLRGALRNQALPTIYFSGASDAALGVAAKVADVHLTWAEPPAQLEEIITRLGDRAAALGRTLRFGTRIDVVARDTEEEAWADVRKFAAGIAQGPGAKRVGSDSHGRARQTALHRGTFDKVEDLLVSPNLWAGMNLLGPVPALVGSYEQVAERLEEYQDIGLTTFILDGAPHLEEAFRVGQEVLPLLRNRRQQGPQPLSAAS
ncbi:MAG: LLM class flavin-dependent oxidoreductase [Myxococcales bacterium]